MRGSLQHAIVKSYPGHHSRFHLRLLAVFPLRGIGQRSNLFESHWSNQWLTLELNARAEVSINRMWLGARIILVLVSPLVGWAERNPLMPRRQWRCAPAFGIV